MPRKIFVLVLLLFVLQFSLHAGEKFNLLMKAHNMLKAGEINKSQYNQLRQRILFDTDLPELGRKNIKYRVIHVDGSKPHGVLDIRVYFKFVVGPKSYSVGKSIMVMDGKLEKLGRIKYSHHSSRNIMVYTGRIKLTPDTYKSLSFNYIIGDNINSAYLYNFVYYKDIKINENEVTRLDVKYDIAEKSSLIDRDIRMNVKQRVPEFLEDPLNGKWETEYERGKRYHLKWKL